MSAGIAEDRDVYLQAFAAFEEALPAASRGITSRLRRPALDRFASVGFPTTRDEEWKYTNVSPIARLPFRMSARPERSEITASRIEGFSFPLQQAHRLVFVNGHFSPESSSRGALPPGVKAMGLAEALEQERDLVEPHLAMSADVRASAFTALNTAFMTDGAFIHVPEGTVVPEPIHLLFVSTSRSGPVATAPRNLVVASRRSHVTVVESYAGAGDGASFTNAVTEIVAGDGASVEHYKIERESDKAFHIATIEGRLGRGASFTSHSVALGGAIVRNDIHAVLAGEGADCTLNGIYLPAGRQHVDHHTVIDHATPHGTSRELYKGVLDGSSRGVFDGKIIVRADAQKTDARQVNRNLILSDEALVDTKPQLEIRADDVKCTHAATIGRIDPEMLFYLRSRAIDESSARAMLTRAFVSEVVGLMKDAPLRSGLEALLSKRMAAAGGAQEGL